MNPADLYDPELDAGQSPVERHEVLAEYGAGTGAMDMERAPIEVMADCEAELARMGDAENNPLLD